MRSLFVAALALACAGPALALPQYGVASGRTCGNCHISPTYEDQGGWPNPELADRKCAMSCLTCHVNPTGGGLRNASGRYFGQSSLSILPLQERSYSDYGRELLSAADVRVLRDALAESITYTSTTPGGRPRAIPSTWAEVQQGVGAGRSGGRVTWGKPLGHPGVMSYWDGRYGDLNADPLVTLGGDFRVAYWSGSESVFPMQADLHLSVHPIEHVTAMGTLAARGRVAGFEAVGQSQPAPVFARNAFLMVHELPYMAYARAGIFQPAFGTHIDDHTSFIRRYFEMDVSKPEDTVLGVELGLAPNYPFANVSVFKNFSPYGTPDGVDSGWGSAIALGWRDLTWHASIHGMIKRRDPGARGDLEAAGVAWGLNPFALSNDIPLTILGELSVGRVDAAGSDRRTTVLAMYHEAWVVIVNGVNARLKYDYGDRDLDLASTSEHRLGFMLDVSVLPGFTIIGGPRLLWAADRDGTQADVMIQTHLWF